MTATAATRTRAVVLRVVWLAIALGIALELCVLVGGAASGARTPLPAQIAADTVQKTSWSTLVCAALAFGAAASRGAVMRTGLAGLLAAPVAFIVARALQKGVYQALTQNAMESAAVPAAVVAGLKAIEYGSFGAAVAWAVRRWGFTLRAHVACGFAAGVVFGAATIALLWPMPAPAVLPRAINELLFPMGCALALWAARALIVHEGGPK
jgi:hypothetical protein